MVRGAEKIISIASMYFFQSECSDQIGCAGSSITDGHGSTIQRMESGHKRHEAVCQQNGARLGLGGLRRLDCAK